MFKILFICTDNIGRSVVAEYLLEDWLAKHGREDIIVASAGTDASSDISSFCMAHLDKLKEMGIDTSMHERRQVTKEMLDDCNLAIVMEEEHQKWIRDRFGTDTLLYNEVYNGESVPLKVSLFEGGSMEDKLIKMVEYIENSMPVLVERINKIKGGRINRIK